MSQTQLIEACYEDLASLRAALLTLSSEAHYDYDVYGPTNLTEFDELMPYRYSLNRGFTVAAAFVGLATFWIMCITTSLIYNLIVGGKPTISNVPFVIPAYEGTIAVAAVAAFAAAIAVARLGLHPPAEKYDARLSRDTYGIYVRCQQDQRDEVVEMLRSTGAVEVHEV